MPKYQFKKTKITAKHVIAIILAACIVLPTIAVIVCSVYTAQFKKWVVGDFASQEYRAYDVSGESDTLISARRESFSFEKTEQDGATVIKGGGFFELYNADGFWLNKFSANRSFVLGTGVLEISYNFKRSGNLIYNVNSVRQKIYEQGGFKLEKINLTGFNFGNAVYLFKEGLAYAKTGVVYVDEQGNEQARSGTNADGSAWTVRDAFSANDDYGYIETDEAILISTVNGSEVCKLLKINGGYTSFFAYKQ